MVLSDLGSPSLATQKSSALDLCLACYSGAKSYNCAISDSYCWMVQFVANPKRLVSRTVHSDRLTIRMAAGCASLLSSLSSKRSPRSKRLQSVCVCEILWNQARKPPGKRTWKDWFRLIRLLYGCPSLDSLYLGTSYNGLWLQCSCFCSYNLTSFTEHCRRCVRFCRIPSQYLSQS